MTIRWGTQESSADTIYYGLSPSALVDQAVESEAVTNHRVTLSNLEPETRYYYRIKHKGQWQKSSADWFVTSPLIENASSTRIWVLGDPGKASKRLRVRNSALGWLQRNVRKGRPDLDLVVSTGDQAYPNGTYNEYVKEFLIPYQGIFKNTPVWPAFGNHDARRWTFYKLFDRPEQAEFGGMPSGSESYFSFEYAQSHIVFIDTNDGDLSIGSDMLNWLQEDLAQSRQKWKIVLFHHPPYTWGTHNSDIKENRKDRMGRVRRNVLPILEKANVDLVINGHSHVYERSHLINKHYGLSNTFDKQTNVIDAGHQHARQTTYLKSASKNGTMYMVIGSSGEGNAQKYVHPALTAGSAKAGSVFLDIDNDYLRSCYVTDDGEVVDQFSIHKPPVLATMDVRQHSP